MKGTVHVAADAIVHFVPAGLDVPMGVVTQLVASLDDFEGWAKKLSDETSWLWVQKAGNDPFHSREGPQVAAAANPDRNLDGARARDQLALFSGYGCDVWNGVLWPALIGLPELAAVQYLATTALPPLERQMLGIGVAVIQTPDVLIVVAPAEGFAAQEKAILLRRLVDLALTQTISIVVLSRPQRILIDQSAATWLN